MEDFMQDEIVQGDTSGKFRKEREALITFAKTNDNLKAGKALSYESKIELIAYRTLQYSVNRALKEQNVPILTCKSGVKKDGKTYIVFFCTELNAKEVTV